MDLNLILNSTTWMLNVVYPDGLRKFFIAMFVLPPCRVLTNSDLFMRYNITLTNSVYCGQDNHVEK